MNNLGYECWWEQNVSSGKYYTIEQFKKILGSKDSRRAYLDIVVNGDWVLDVGCGVGLDCEYYKKNNVTVNFFGIDVTWGFVSLNQKIYQEDNFVQGRAYSLPFKDKMFDVCTCRHVLEHLADSLPTIREMCRVSNQVAIIWFVPPGDEDKIRITKKGFYKNTYNKDRIKSEIDMLGFSLDIKDISLEGRNHQLWHLKSSIL